MTNQEFSDRFDVLVNAFNIQLGFGLQDYLAFNEYEKSLFLTQALSELVISFYDGKNAYGNIFERTEEDRRFLNNLVKTKTITEPLNNSNSTLHSSYSYLYKLPVDVLFITYEQATFKNGKVALVVPVTLDDYYKTVLNPFRGPTLKRVLRLDMKGMVELISKYDIKSYQLRYVSKPKPIILTDLPDGLEIWGSSTELACELNDATHELILNRAVQLALSSKNVGANK